MTNRFIQALNRKNEGTPPIWLMRQAGRYHHHYQTLRQKHGFVNLCKNPDLACEVAMGPIEDFDFDAAILFSDILFPIEEMGINLAFDPGPQFERSLKTPEDLTFYEAQPETLSQNMVYQQQALAKTRLALPNDKGLIGFIGGPLTLYIFAVEGSHKGDLSSAYRGLTDGRFDGFMKKIVPMLVTNMVLQAKANPDCLAILDSAAGLLSAEEYKTLYLPHLQTLIDQFHEHDSTMPLLYYGKNITLDHWDTITTLNIQALGVDHSLSLTTMLERYAEQFAIQGNLPPETMSLPQDDAEREIDSFLETISALPSRYRRGWICGLGHGILPTANENNVRLFVKKARNI